MASHLRSGIRGRHTTDPSHMPKSHQKHMAWTPSRLIHWGESVGEDTGGLVAAILADRPHPEQGYRSCLGILRLGKRYGNDRLEAACARARRVGARSYRHVESILKNGLDRVGPADPATDPQLFSLSKNVFSKGDTLSVTDPESGNTRVLNLDYDDTEGPPLHPQCRCALLPVIS